jgi:hypothetical protein
LRSAPIVADRTAASPGGVDALHGDLGYLRQLRDFGREAAARWLERSFEEIGGRSDA